MPGCADLNQIHSYLFTHQSTEEYQADLERYRKRRSEAAVEQAIRGGKEPFDFGRFASLYSHDTGDCQRLSPDEPANVQSYYREMYYFDFQQIMTVAAFAHELDAIDAQG